MATKKNPVPFRPSTPAAKPAAPAAPVAPTTNSHMQSAGSRSTSPQDVLRNLGSTKPDLDAFLNEASEDDKRDAVVLPGGATIENAPNVKLPPWEGLDDENAVKAFNLNLSDAGKERLNYICKMTGAVKVRYCQVKLEAILMAEAEQLWEEKHGKR